PAATADLRRKEPGGRCSARPAPSVPAWCGGLAPVQLVGQVRHRMWGDLVLAVRGVVDDLPVPTQEEGAVADGLGVAAVPHAREAGRVEPVQDLQLTASWSGGSQHIQVEVARDVVQARQALPALLPVAEVRM